MGTGKGFLLLKPNPANRKGYFNYITMHVLPLVPAADTSQYDTEFPGC